jgi:hypothetical protein
MTPTAAGIASKITAATSKTTPVDADEIPIADSAASFGLKKLTFANLNATLNTLYVGLTGDQTVAGTKTFGQIKIPGPYADDSAAAVAGVLDDRLYFQPAGSVVANVDHLSLDLQFAADKTLTARKGPTPTFTRASTATFVGSDGLIQSAAINTPRFDHDPVTLACKGLLIEEARTNQILQSADFVSASWATNNATISSNVAISPDGLTTADKLIVNSGTTVGRVNQSFTLTGAHTMSVFAKADGWNWLLIAPLGGGTGVWFNLSNGTVGTQLSGFVGSITSFGNGWYKCSVAFTGAGVSHTARFVSTNADNAVSVGDGTSGIFLWGAQLEAGAFPTSYIPTVASTVVRSADVCSITGSNFTGFWNRFAGTCVVGVGSSLGSVPRFVSNLTAARTLEIWGTTNIDFFEASGGQLIRIVTNPTYPIKLGLAYAINDYQSSYNGLLGGSDTNTGGTIPDATQLHIGNLGGTSDCLTGHIQSIRYYKKRLANAKLQALTV